MSEQSEKKEKLTKTFQLVSTGVTVFGVSIAGVGAALMANSAGAENGAFGTAVAGFVSSLGGFVGVSELNFKNYFVDEAQAFKRSLQVSLAGAAVGAAFTISSLFLTVSAQKETMQDLENRLEEITAESKAVNHNVPNVELLEAKP